MFTNQSMIFYFASQVVSIYSFACLIRIILTWISLPSTYKISNMLATICDPYLNLFRGIRWLRLGSFDFSPALAFIVLDALSQFLKFLSFNKAINADTIIAILFQMISSAISSILIFIIFLFIVRFVIVKMTRSDYSSNYMLNIIDSSISPLVYKIAGTFTFGKRVPYSTALLIAAAVLFVILILSIFLFQIIFSAIVSLPV